MCFMYKIIIDGRLKKCVEILEDENADDVILPARTFYKSCLNSGKSVVNYYCRIAFRFRNLINAKKKKKIPA